MDYSPYPPPPPPHIQRKTFTRLKTEFPSFIGKEEERRGWIENNKQTDKNWRREEALGGRGGNKVYVIKRWRYASSFNKT